MKKVSVLIKNPSMQYEGLRTSLGLLLEDVAVSMFVLDHEIQDFSEAYSDNLGFLEEMEGIFYSNNIANVEKYRFQYANSDKISTMLKEAELIIPF
jgi:hypothetical protein